MRDAMDMMNRNPQSGGIGGINPAKLSPESMAQLIRSMNSMNNLQGRLVIHDMSFMMSVKAE